MPQTIYGGQVKSETLRAGKALTISVEAGSGGVLEQWRNGRVVASSAIASSTTVGPFIDDTVLRISAFGGSTLSTSEQTDQIASRATDAKASALDAAVSEAGTTTWANRANVLAAGLSQAFFTDVGVGGTDFVYRSGVWRPRNGKFIMKNLVTPVSNSGAPKVVLDAALIPAGLLLDNDSLEIEFVKTREGGTSDTDATDVMIGASAATLGTSTGLSTTALATTTVLLAPHYELTRVSATSVRMTSLPGGVGFGSASALPSTTTGLTNMDSNDVYLQVTSDLTTAGGEVAWLRKFRVTFVAGS